MTLEAAALWARAEWDMGPDEFWCLTQHQLNVFAKRRRERAKREQTDRWEQIRAVSWYTARLGRERKFPSWDRFVPERLPRPPGTLEKAKADEAEMLKRHGFDPVTRQKKRVRKTADGQ